VFQVSSGPVALAASATKTFVDLATTANNVARVSKWWVGSDAVSAGTATSDIRVQIGLFTAAVTTHTAVVPDPFDGADGGVAANTVAGIATTSEGAGTPLGVRIEEWPLALVQSWGVVWEPVPRLVPPSSFWRIRLIAPAGIGTTNIYAGCGFTE
jgi:hypothetical protein